MKFRQLTVADIASVVGGDVEGDSTCEITGVSGLADAGRGDLSFLANHKYASLLDKTEASCVIVDRVTKAVNGVCLLRVDNPDLAFAKAVEVMVEPVPAPLPGIHESAVVSLDAKLGDDVSVGPNCVIESGAVIGERTQLRAGCYVGHETAIGADCIFMPNVSIYHRLTIGDRVIVHSGAVIGSDGFGYVWDGKSHQKVQQVGTVEIGSDVEIGANTVIDRARFGRTVIGEGSKLDNLIQIAHNVEIGQKCAFAAQVGIAGSTKVGDGVLLGGKVGIIGHLEIASGARLSALAGVTKNLGPGHHTGYPARPHNVYIDESRNIKAVARLRRQMKELERRIAELEA